MMSSTRVSMSVCVWGALLLSAPAALAGDCPSVCDMPLLGDMNGDGLVDWWANQNNLAGFGASDDADNDGEIDQRRLEVLKKGEDVELETGHEASKRPSQTIGASIHMKVHTPVRKLRRSVYSMRPSKAQGKDRPPPSHVADVVKIGGRVGAQRLGGRGVCFNSTLGGAGLHPVPLTPELPGC